MIKKLLATAIAMNFVYGLETCAICHEEITQEQAPRFQCRHNEFHDQCSNKWIIHRAESFKEPNCPTCRAPVIDYKEGDLDVWSVEDSVWLIEARRRSQPNLDNGENENNNEDANIPEENNDSYFSIADQQTDQDYINYLNRNRRNDADEINHNHAHENNYFGIDSRDSDINNNQSIENENVQPFTILQTYNIDDSNQNVSEDSNENIINENSINENIINEDSNENIINENIDIVGNVIHRSNNNASRNENTNVLPTFNYISKPSLVNDNEGENNVNNENDKKLLQTSIIGGHNDDIKKDDDGTTKPEEQISAGLTTTEIVLIATLPIVGICIIVLIVLIVLYFRRQSSTTAVANDAIAQQVQESTYEQQPNAFEQSNGSPV